MDPKVDNNGISCLFDNDSLLLRLSIMLRPTKTKLGVITLQSVIIYTVITFLLILVIKSQNSVLMMIAVDYESYYYNKCGNLSDESSLGVDAELKCLQIHAMIEASMPTCSRFERPPSHQALSPVFISFIPPFHISNTNSLIKLPISHCLTLVQVDKNVLTYVPFIHTPRAYFYQILLFVIETQSSIR